MRVMVDGVLPYGGVTELELNELLEPEVDPQSESEVRLCRTIGKLGALLVVKGVCTIKEAQEVCGVTQYTVVGRPTTR